MKKIRGWAVAGSVVVALGCLWTTSATAQTPPGGGFPNVLSALKAAPGCLGVETGQNLDRPACHLCVVRKQEGTGRLVSLRRSSESDEVRLPEPDVRS